MITSADKNSTPKTFQDFSPMELITHVVVALQLADGRIDFEERESWAEILTELLPEHNPDRATGALREAIGILLEMDLASKMEYAGQAAAHLKDHFPAETLTGVLVPKLAEMVEADGIVFSAENDMLEKLKEILA